MWKKLLAVTCACLMSWGVASSASAAESSKYQEDVHYQVRTDKLTANKEIREFFSFWCGHCFSLQGDFDAIAKAYPHARFERNPVAVLGGMMGPETQRAVAVAQNLGIEDLFVHELFTAMHTKHQIPMSHQELSVFMTTLGVSQDKFEREFNSFPVVGKVAQFDKWSNDINLEAVPEILVNGKYLVTMESVNTREELIDLVGFLLTKDNVPDAK